MSNPLADRIYDDYCANIGHYTGTAYNALRNSQIQQEQQQQRIQEYKQQRNDNAVRCDVPSSSGQGMMFDGAYMPQPARRGSASSSSKEERTFEEILGLSVACGGAWWGYTSNLALPWYGWGIGFMALWLIATRFFCWAVWLTRLIRLAFILTISFYGLRELNEAGILTVANLKATLNLLVGLVI